MELVAIFMSLFSAITSISSVFYLHKKFKTFEKTESHDTTSITIENEATREEHKDGSNTTTKKQKIHLTDIDIGTDSKFAMGSESSTRTGLPNKTAEILAGGGAGAIQALAGRLLPNRVVREEEKEKEAPLTIHEPPKSKSNLLVVRPEGGHEVSLRIELISDGEEAVKALGDSDVVEA